MGYSKKKTLCIMDYIVLILIIVSILLAMTSASIIVVTVLLSPYFQQAKLVLCCISKLCSNELVSDLTKCTPAQDVNARALVASTTTPVA